MKKKDDDVIIRVDREAAEALREKHPDLSFNNIIRRYARLKPKVSRGRGGTCLGKGEKRGKTRRKTEVDGSG